MKDIPDNLNRLLANTAVVDTLEEFERAARPGSVRQHRLVSVLDGPGYIIRKLAPARRYHAGQ